MPPGANLSAVIDLGGDLWMSKTPPVDIDRVWREWIGSIHADALADANLWFVAKRGSARPEVLDQENEELKADAT